MSTHITLDTVYFSEVFNSGYGSIDCLDENDFSLGGNVQVFESTPENTVPLSSRYMIVRIVSKTNSISLGNCTQFNYEVTERSPS